MSEACTNEPPTTSLRCDTRDRISIASATCVANRDCRGCRCSVDAADWCHAGMESTARLQGIHQRRWREHQRPRHACCSHRCARTRWTIESTLRGHACGRWCGRHGGDVADRRSHRSCTGRERQQAGGVSSPRGCVRNRWPCRVDQRGAGTSRCVVRCDGCAEPSRPDQSACPAWRSGCVVGSRGNDGGGGRHHHQVG